MADRVDRKSDFSLHLFASITIILAFFPHTSVSGTQSCCDIPHCSLLVNDSIATYPSYSNLTTEDLIRLFNFPVERHNVTTEDDYILGVQRIPSSNSSAIPVFLMHGILASSAQWFWQPPSRALVFMLAEAGYDVWIGNARGTSYSLGHKTLSSDDLKFWNFSSYEMGCYDIPAVINHILQQTNQSSLYYVGHSLGGQQFFVAMSERPELNSKIRTMFALAPASYTGNTTNAFLSSAAPFFAPYANEQTVELIGGGRFVPAMAARFLGDFTPYCGNLLASCGFCSNFYFLIAGFSPCQTNFTTLPGFLAHEPDSISVKTFSHSSQAIRTGKFRQYDYGYFKNLKVYGTGTPPDYSWANVTAPVVLFYGLGDSFVVPKDNLKTAAALGSSLKELIQVNYTCWQHLDFVNAVDADTFVYNKILLTMNARTYG